MSEDDKRSNFSRPRKICIYSIQEIQLLVSFVKREQKEDNTSRFIAEILGPRAVSVVYVCFVC